MKSDELQICLKLAEHAAKEAGKFLLRRESFETKDSTARDTKLSADTDAEKIILDLIQSESNVPILSEEAGGDVPAGALWIIDPLDGTVNYSRDIPIAAISISLWNDGKPLLGVVYDFNRGEMFSGIVGGGACVNQKNIHVSLINTLEKAIIYAGFPVAADFTGSASWDQPRCHSHMWRRAGVMPILSGASEFGMSPPG